ncbi:hypothetical protein CBR_g10979 [Chara braunii]|uniref:EF-hand domain-containing protein n=1 Tax=Chara braunii TaxID=69332 RepID=A0A388KPR0_CHABU|nr:hypothetical protein CBR_g10979 [Chara braunii]|eukprot:GBG72044.1 hypothetical protein CBR_g10979 [Chara braunii]
MRLHDPIMLDGSQIRKFLDNESAFDAYVDSKFASADVNRNYRVSSAELRVAVETLGADFGVPPPGSKEAGDRLVQTMFEEYGRPGDDELDRDSFKNALRDVLLGIADGLADDPIVMALLTGDLINSILSDEDEFEVLATSIFSELDENDNGSISKSEIRSAVAQLGLEMGIPIPEGQPATDVVLHKIYEKFNISTVEGDELDEEAFMVLLRKVMHDLAGELSENPVMIAQNVKVLNGTALRKILRDPLQLKDITDRLFDKLDKNDDDKLSNRELRPALRRLGMDIGIPDYCQGRDDIEKLFARVFDKVDKDSNGVIDQEEFADFVKGVLTGLAEDLEVYPIIVEVEAPDKTLIG